MRHTPSTSVNRRHFAALVGIGTVGALAAPFAQQPGKPETYPSPTGLMGARNPALDHVFAEYNRVWTGLATSGDGADTTALLATFASAQRLELRAMRESGVESKLRDGVRKAVESKGKPAVAEEMLRGAERSEQKFERLYQLAGRSKRKKVQSSLAEFEAAIDTVLTTDLTKLFDRSIALVEKEMARQAKGKMQQQLRARPTQR